MNCKNAESREMKNCIQYLEALNKNFSLMIVNLKAYEQTVILTELNIL